MSIIRPRPRHDLGDLIPHLGVKQQILNGLRAICIRDQLEEVWSISRLQPQLGAASSASMGRRRGRRRTLVFRLIRD